MGHCKDSRSISITSLHRTASFTRDGSMRFAPRRSVGSGSGTRYGFPLCSCAVGALDKPAWSASVGRRHTHYSSRTPVERENGSSSLNDHGKACCDIQQPPQLVTATVDREPLIGCKRHHRSKSNGLGWFASHWMRHSSTTGF